ncbi:PREDICTED: alpha-tocopherol transfer protein-like [Trachymyrmex cornetzi]|uniref:alpha-tocopherol transfer protein-like n=1 Tax=Trachymyrmex cornetzi TaxID=471704 RepID=UPI00084EFFBB|nr:PREDICTED: alpha-tocopherol transfer protein-like [Trachymyrmex cornetzi]
MASLCGDSVECYAQHKLTNEEKRYAAAHLNETDETRENAIKEIKRWLEQSDDLHVRIDDFFILRFLRVCKFNLEKTKIRIRNYYKQRSDLPEWYTNIDPFRPELQELLDLGYYLPLRKPDNQGRLVFIVHGTRHDPRIHKISDIYKVGMIATEVAVKCYPAASVYGYTIFIDVSNPTLQHITQLRPYVLMNFVHAWQNCYPARVQSINIFNAPVFFDVVVKIFKSFMTEKLKSRFHVYSRRTMQNCFKDIPANILPVEYGGTDGTIKDLTEYWKKLIEENRDWLMNEGNDEIIISK